MPKNCVIQVIDTSKNKQIRDNIKFNMKVEIEIDVYSNVKQAEKWQVFRHVTERNTNK